MAFKARKKPEPTFESLDTILVNSKLQTTNNANYQVIKELIGKIKELQTLEDNKFVKIQTELDELTVSTAISLNILSNSPNTQIHPFLFLS